MVLDQQEDKIEGFKHYTCKDCKKRHSACHSTCKEYNDIRKSNFKLKNIIRKDKNINRKLDELAMDRAKVNKRFIWRDKDC